LIRVRGITTLAADERARYATFFGLFEDFRGYIDFFFLQDLVTDDHSSVRFWAPFDNFTTSPFLADIDAYLRYRSKMFRWVDARNQRIAAEFVLRPPNMR